MIKTGKELKSYYNRGHVVSQYDRKRFRGTYGRIQHEFELGIINSCISGLKNPRILEIAVGTGRVTKDINGVGIGIDASENMLEKARKKVKGWKFIKMDIKSLRFREKFDIVVSLRLIRHFQKKDRKDAYRKIRRCLSKNGLLVFDMPTGRHNRFLEFVDRFKKQDHIYEADTPADEVRRELEESGFRVIRMHNTKYESLYFRALCLINDKINIFYPSIRRYMKRYSDNLGLATNVLIIAKAV